MRLIGTFLLFIFTVFSFSQKIKIEKGDVSILKNVNEYTVIFDYSNLEIINFESEKTFLEDKVSKREILKKGTGLKFKKDWFAYRTEFYEPYFISSFNDYFIMKRKIKISKVKNTKYTILVKSKSIYPGYNVGVAFEAAKLNTEITIFETSNPKNIIIKTKTIKVYQGDSAYNLGYRIANSYGVLGRSLAKFLRKKT